MLSFTTNELEIVYTPDEFNNSCDVREEISKICEDGSKIMVEKLTTVVVTLKILYGIKYV